MESQQVQSLRNVGCKKGFSYYAWGVYEPHATRDGRLVYRLVRSGPWVRSDKYGRKAFAGIPVVQGVRHNSPAPPQTSAAQAS